MLTRHLPYWVIYVTATQWFVFLFQWWFSRSMRRQARDLLATQNSVTASIDTLKVYLAALPAAPTEAEVQAILHKLRTYGN